VVLVLLWVYYSAQILFFGAEITKVYANRFGAHLQPASYARWVNSPEVAPETSIKAAAGKTKITESHPARQQRLLLELKEEVESLRAIVRGAP
jgi:membrane protein